MNAMQLIDTISEIEENIAYFEEHLSSSSEYEREFILKRLSQGKNYIAYKVGKEIHFVPSRFVGYKHNSVRRHDNGSVDGKETSRRLRKVGLLGADVPNAKLEALLVKQCAKYGVVLSNREHTFWTISSDMQPSIEKVKEEAEEGRKLFAHHTKYERSAKLAAVAKTRYLRMHEAVCEACGFDFENVYGSLGSGYIEAHHSKPLNERKSAETTTIDDFNFLCSNCHSMIHRDVHSALTLEELKQVIKEHRSIKKK